MRWLFPLLLAVTLASCGKEASHGWQGYVEGEFVLLASPYAGQLQKLNVRRGDQVQQGKPVFALAQGGTFANCIAKNLLNFALAETPSTPIATNACAVRNVSDAFAASGDGTFGGLVRTIAVSTTLASRSGGLP